MRKMFCLPVTGCLLLAAGLLLGACSTRPANKTRDREITRQGESLVFSGEEAARLAFVPLQKNSLSLRNHYRADAPGTVLYEEGRDYLVDYDQGILRRTATSRIPDFRTNSLYGAENFDHGKFPGFGNMRFFAYADYRSKNRVDWPVQPAQEGFLAGVREKLRQGGKVKIVAFGDSITAGGDTSEPGLIFWRRFGDSLQQRYPAATLQVINGATGGDTTRDGMARLEAKVLRENPDLVLIGFGMNDHNIPPYGVALNDFTENLRAMIDRIRTGTEAEIILYSTFPPNPKWRFGSHRMEAYALATEKVAHEKQCAFADIYGNWQFLAAHKKPEDLLANNINHPNDFGHWVYFQVLERLGL